MFLDKEHIGKIIQAERARLSLESIMRNSCNELQSMEEERISYVKNMLRVYGETLKESVPKVSQVRRKIIILFIFKICRNVFTVKGEYLDICHNLRDKRRRKLALGSKYEGGRT